MTSAMSLLTVSVVAVARAVPIDRADADTEPICCLGNCRVVFKRGRLDFVGRGLCLPDKFWQKVEIVETVLQRDFAVILRFEQEPHDEVIELTQVSGPGRTLNRRE